MSSRRLFSILLLVDCIIYIIAFLTTVLVYFQIVTVFLPIVLFICSFILFLVVLKIEDEISVSPYHKVVTGKI